MDDDLDPGGDADDDDAGRKSAAEALEYADEYALHDIGVALRLRALDAVD